MDQTPSNRWDFTVRVSAIEQVPNNRFAFFVSGDGKTFRVHPNQMPKGMQVGSLVQVYREQKVFCVTRLELVEETT